MRVSTRSAVSRSPQAPHSTRSPRRASGNSRAATRKTVLSVVQPPRVVGEEDGHLPVVTRRGDEGLRALAATSPPRRPRTWRSSAPRAGPPRRLVARRTVNRPPSSACLVVPTSRPAFALPCFAPHFVLRGYCLAGSRTGGIGQGHPAGDGRTPLEQRPRPTSHTHHRPAVNRQSPTYPYPRPPDLYYWPRWQHHGRKAHDAVPKEKPWLGQMNSTAGGMG